MLMYFVFVIFIAIFGHVGCFDRVEHNTVNVHIEHVKNTMVVVTGSTCFIVKLTTEELHQAANDFGREKLIMTIMRDVIGQATEHKIYHNDRGLTDDMRNWCAKRDMYFLMRDATTTTTKPTVSVITTRVQTLTTTGSNLTINTTKGRQSTSTRPTTTAPVIMYDRTLSMKVVIVTTSGCFVYRMSEVDKNLLNIGSDGKDFFEESSMTSTQSPYPDLYLYRDEIPIWLQVVLGITAVTAALLLLTCLILCCMRLCGCWTGNILGVGSLRRPMDDTDHLGCWCCRPAVVSADGSYVSQWRNSSRR